jgi:hypothetical protein
MRKIKEVLRLKFEARLSHERIAAATGVSKGTVSSFVQRAVRKGLGWPLPEDLDEAGLEALLFRQAAPCEEYERPEFAMVHQELKRKGVTLQLLWEEYRVPHGERAYAYSQFCALYRVFRDSLARSMRQVHRAGEKLFIDYSGDTVAVIDAGSGEIRAAQIFVAVMGASKYAYARRHGRRACRTGSHPTSARSSSCRQRRVCLFQIISRARLNWRAATSRRRPPLTRTWRAITAAPFYRLVHAAGRISLPPNPGYSWYSDGF